MGYVDLSPNNPSFVMAVPVALFEIVVMPVWLLWKGFDTSAAAQ